MTKTSLSGFLLAVCASGVWAQNTPVGTWLEVRGSVFGIGRTQTWVRTQ